MVLWQSLMEAPGFARKWETAFAGLLPSVRDFAARYFFKTEIRERQRYSMDCGVMPATLMRLFSNR